MAAVPPPGAAELLVLLEESELLLRKGGSPHSSVTIYARNLADEIATLRLSLARNPEGYDESRESIGGSRPPGAAHFPKALAAVEGSVGTSRLRRSLEKVATRFPWSSFYAPDAWSRAFIDDIAALKLIGPGSPLPSQRMAVGLFLMGANLLYPLHAHAAEELYLILAGRVSFRTGPREAWRDRGPGDLVLHRSQEPHEMRTGAAAALMLYFWRGEIFEPSWYKGEMGSPEEPPKYPEM